MSKKIPRTDYSNHYDNTLATVRQQVQLAMNGLTREASAEWLREVEKIINRAKTDISDIDQASR